MATRKPVPASEVRAFLTSDEGKAALEAAGVSQVGTRGRISEAQRAVYRKANPTRTYEEGVAEGRTVPVPVPQDTANGQTRVYTREIPTAEVRSLAAELGVEVGERGRLSADALAQVGAALAKIG